MHPNASTAPHGAWVDDTLLAGPDGSAVLNLGTVLDRATLRRLVHARQERLHEAGFRPGDAVAIRLPPSVEFIANLLAVWRAGGQAVLLDYRLTEHEIERSLQRCDPYLVVAPTTAPAGTLRGYFEIDSTLVVRDGTRPAATGHALIQLSSGSTGPSKVIGRTAQDLVAEIDRFTQIDGFPVHGDQLVVLGSMAHVLGLVGGLLYSLHAGVEMIVPKRTGADGVLRALQATTAPTFLLGVPSQAELLVSAPNPPQLPNLQRMITGGELVSDLLWQRFNDRFGAGIGTMYGMTEIGVIATDIFGKHRPGLCPAPGHQVRASDAGELLLRMPESPYVGLVDPSRWSDGWLHTRDAGTVSGDGGLVEIRGRMDSQVSIGGLKVDLTEVEQTLAGAPGVTGAVVVYDEAIQAYVTLTEPAAASGLDSFLRERLAAYKRPRAIHVLAALPRTSSGKPVRDPAALRTAERLAGAR